MKQRKPVLRRCVGCAEMKDKRTLTRIVLKQNGDVSVDFTGKEAGRGAYVCMSVDCMEKASKGKGLEKSYKRAVPKEVYESLKNAMAEHVNTGESTGERS